MFTEEIIQVWVKESEREKRENQVSCELTSIECG